MAVESVASASNLQMDYMKLLIAQLQNQNPLEPMSNTEMASQMAQFSQLQQLEGMNKSFSEVLRKTELQYANSLVGQRVVFSAADGQLASGVVEAVGITSDGIILKVGNYEVELDALWAISS
ncbi:MAG TPA: flagellar hook capping FlgD N-terminal domain-containing protein [Sedimentisphaerales bacterium]|nr:flagellar hook capping FlgD N-terminal domain-containing protein [Sedimentisphaerales bacterium]